LLNFRFTFLYLWHVHCHWMLNAHLCVFLREVFFRVFILNFYEWEWRMLLLSLMTGCKWVVILLTGLLKLVIVWNYALEFQKTFTDLALLS